MANDLTINTKKAPTSAEAEEIIRKAVITVVEVHVGFDGEYWVAERKKTRGIGWTVIAKRKNKKKLLDVVDVWFEKIPVDPCGINMLGVSDYG